MFKHGFYIQYKGTPCIQQNIRRSRIRRHFGTGIVCDNLHNSLNSYPVISGLTSESIKLKLYMSCRNCHKQYQFQNVDESFSYTQEP